MSDPRLAGLSYMAIKRFLKEAGNIPKAELDAASDKEDLLRVAARYQVLMEPLLASVPPSTQIHSAGRMEDEYDGERNIAGQREGHGTMKLANGSVYEGEWKADQYDGRGVYTTHRGEVYDGEYRSGVMEGHGSYLFANGDFYEGQYKSGLMHGHGLKRDRGSGEVYEGDFKLGNKDGTGMIKYAGGETMLSRFIADEPMGEGIIWNAGRSEAWRIQDGQPVEAVSEQTASCIAET
jgi:hypothetical protein